MRFPDKSEEQKEGNKLMLNDYVDPEYAEQILKIEAIPAWVIVAIAGIFSLTILLLTLIYMPRTAEILRLRKIIKAQSRTITRMSKEQTAAELEHKADVGDLSSRLLEAQGKQDQIAEEYAGKLAQANARTEQSKSLRGQLARAADKLRGEAIA